MRGSIRLVPNSLFLWLLRRNRCRGNSRHRGGANYFYRRALRRAPEHENNAHQECQQNEDRDDCRSRGGAGDRATIKFYCHGKSPVGYLEQPHEKHSSSAAQIKVCTAVVQSPRRSLGPLASLLFELACNRRKGVPQSSSSTTGVCRRSARSLRCSTCPPPASRSIRRV